MNTCKPIMWVVGAFIFANIIYDFATKGFFGALNMNLVIFLFVGINCFLFPQPTAWINAHADSLHLATDIIMQFPFYGAIMGMMYIEGGLGSVLISAITSVATAQTLPVFTFLSALPGQPVHPLSGRSVHRAGPPDRADRAEHPGRRPGHLPERLRPGRRVYQPAPALCMSSRLCPWSA